MTTTTTENNVIDTIRAIPFVGMTTSQKAAAIAYMREHGDHDYSDFIIEEWKSKLSVEYGITEAEILFSGFWSQGDGASISTGYYIDLEVFLRKVKKWSKFKAIQKAIHDEEISVKVDRLPSLYVHENTVSANIFMDYSIDWTTKQGAAANGLEELVTEEIRQLSKQVYAELEKEYEYRQTDEAITDMIECNDYSFKVNDNGDVLGIAYF